MVNAYITQESNADFPEVVLMDVNASAGTYYTPFTGILDEKRVYTELRIVGDSMETSWYKGDTGEEYLLSTSQGSKIYKYLGTALVYDSEFNPDFSFKSSYYDNGIYEGEATTFAIGSYPSNIYISRNDTETEVEVYWHGETGGGKMPRDKYGIPYTNEELILLGSTTIIEEEENIWVLEHSERLEGVPFLVNYINYAIIK